jgi:trehalose 6-phosphate phosphatase
VLPEPTTPAGRAGLAAILADPSHALLAFDYDGTLSPIVDDPAAAAPQAGVVDRLEALSSLVGVVAVITGRPAAQAVELGGLSAAPGLRRLVVLGQYGVERWERSRGLQTIQPPAGVDDARRTLPDLLASLGLESAQIEDKRLALVVHVRNTADPAAAFERMRQPLAELARATGLTAEAGRYVVELRPPGMDKGQALRSLVEESGATSLMFTGDDVGDLPAFAAARGLRAEGVPGLLVWSVSDEVAELADEADLAVAGPAGVVDFLDTLIEALSDRSG